MFSPKELEGEVDYSFFDSDSEAGIRDVARPPYPKPEGRVGGGGSDDGGEPGPFQTSQGKNAIAEGILEKDFSRLKILSEEKSNTRQARSQSRNSNTKGGGASGKGDLDSSSDQDGSEHRSGSQSDSSNRRSYSGQNDAKCKGARKDKSEALPKHRCDRNRSPSSSSGSDRATPPTSRQLSGAQPRPSPQRWFSVGRKEKSKTDSEDTVTDVTPLSSPDVSPPQSCDLPPPTSPAPPTKPAVRSDGQKRSVRKKKKGLRKKSPDTDDGQRPGSSRSGRQQDRALLAPSSASMRSANSSGSSRQTRQRRKIEGENQRLCRELSHTSFQTYCCSSSCSSFTPSVRLYHTALNRQREQERIQRANLTLLTRLESIKASPGMSRSEQLADYQRQSGYMGAPPPLARLSSGRTSRTSHSSAASHWTKPKTAKASRTSVPRPAWC